jgi:carboxymethylenebutenolidase
MKYLLALLPLCAAVGCSARPAPTNPSPPVPSAETVAYRRDTQTLRGVLCRPTGEGPFPAVVLVHGDFGLTDWEKARAQELAAAGFVALAVDLYHGQTVSNVLDAHIMDRAMPDEQVQGDLQAAVDYLSGRADVRREAIGIVGWDSGGGYALDAAVHDARLRAVVICYGRVMTEPKSLAPLRAAVLGIFAGQDEGISAETLRQFESAMKKAGKRLAGVEVYPRCKHGFMNPAASERSSADAAAAWKKIVAFLAAELKN